MLAGTLSARRSGSRDLRILSMLTPNAKGSAKPFQIEAYNSGVPKSHEGDPKTSPNLIKALVVANGLHQRAEPCRSDRRRSVGGKRPRHLPRSRRAVGRASGRGRRDA